jgi:hypothetical protein
MAWVFAVKYRVSLRSEMVFGIGNTIFITGFFCIRGLVDSGMFQSESAKAKAC